MFTINLICPVCRKKIYEIKEQTKTQLIVICDNCGEINIVKQNRGFNPVEETKKKLPAENYFEW